MAAGCPMCFQGRVWGFFTFYELVSSRLLSRWSIRFGMWEARNRKGNCGSKQCCLLSQLCPHSFGSILGRKPPWKRRYCNVSLNAFSDPYPHTKKRGGSIPPAPSQFRLLTPSSPPNNGRVVRRGGGSSRHRCVARRVLCLMELRRM